MPYPASDLYPSSTTYPGFGDAVSGEGSLPIDGGVRVTVRELPPLRLAINVQAPNGVQRRWARDEPNPENVPSGLSFSTSAPGGFEAFGCTLPRRAELDYVDLEQLTRLTVSGPSGKIAWEGRLEGSPRDSDPSRLTVSPTGVGYQAHLEDDKSVVVVYVDRDLGAWTEPSIQRRINLLSVGTRMNGSFSAGGQDSASTTAALTTHLDTASSGAGTDRVEVWYYGGGADLGEIRYTLDSNVASDPLWESRVFFSDDDVATNTTNGTDHDAADVSTDTGQTTTALRKYAAVVWAVDSSATVTNTTMEGQWKNLRVFGLNALTRRGAAPDDGVYASDVIVHVLRWAPLIRATTGTTGTITASDFVIPQLAFKDPTTTAEVISSANRFSLRDWFIWEGQRPGEPTAYYHERGARGTAWRARVGPSKLSEAGPSIDRLWNGVIVRYQDVDGTSRSVGPPGSDATETSALLIDTDPEHPANKLGIRRWTTLDMGGVSTPAGAIAVGARFREQARALNTSGQAQLTGYAEDSHGTVRPAWQIRAGDTISFIDSNDPSPRRVIKTNYEDSSKTNSVDLDAPPDGLAALLERLQVVLVPLGL